MSNIRSSMHELLLCPTLSLISHVTPHPCANTVDPPKNKLQLNSSNQSSEKRCVQQVLDFTSNNAATTQITGSESEKITQEMSKSFPSYRELCPPNFTWGSISASEFQPLIESAYAEVVHWRCNLFQVPSGSIRNKFVLKLAKLFQAFVDAASLESVAITAAMVMPHLLL